MATGASEAALVTAIPPDGAAATAGARQTIGQARAAGFSALTTNYPCFAACETAMAAVSGAAGEIRLLVSTASE
jgi:hypothetical protein